MTHQPTHEEPPFDLDAPLPFDVEMGSWAPFLADQETTVVSAKCLSERLLFFSSFLFLGSIYLLIFELIFPIRKSQ